MTILISSLTDVTIDGNPSGGVVDALFHASAIGDDTLRAPMLDALTAFIASEIAKDKVASDEVVARIASERDAAKAEAEAATAKLAELIALQTALVSQAAAHAANGDLAGLQSVILEAQKPDKQRALEAAQAEKQTAEDAAAAAQAKIDALA